MSRIAVDAHALGTHAGGNETFVQRLLHGLRIVQPKADVVALVNRNSDIAPEDAAGFPLHRLSTNSSWLRVPWALPKAVRATNADLLHVQYIAPPRCPCPFVVTLHDMVWLRYPETMRCLDRTRLNLLVPGTLRRAARVFVVSEAMKTEAARLYGLEPAKMDVVYNALDPRFTSSLSPETLEGVRRKYALDTPYVLYVGSIHPRKNVVRLAEAFARIAKELPHKLVLVGRPSWFSGDIMARLESLRLGERLVRTGYAASADLPALVAAADAFAYVSLYEGFGLPVLEAMACGTPVLTSTDAALSEVVGDAALRADATDVDSIAANLSRLLTDAVLRERLRTEGPQRAAFFSTERMGHAAWEGYQRALA